jgi:tricorn protease-like protein
LARRNADERFYRLFLLSGKVPDGHIRFFERGFRVNEGAVFIGTNNEDMVEFLQYVRERGGECICTDYDMKRIQIVKGTTNDEKVELFNIDGVLGVVNVDNTDPGEAEQTGRRELLQGDEGNLLQSEYETDLRTG